MKRSFIIAGSIIFGFILVVCIYLIRQTAYEIVTDDEFMLYAMSVYRENPMTSTDEFLEIVLDIDEKKAVEIARVNMFKRSNLLDSALYLSGHSFIEPFKVFYNEEEKCYVVVKKMINSEFSTIVVVSKINGAILAVTGALG